MDCVLAARHRDRAHVAEWERLHGPIPEGHFIAHPCGNTLCVAHMEVVGFQRSSTTKRLNEDDRLRIKELYPQMRKAELAAVFGIQPWQVYQVVRQSRYEYKGGISDKVKRRAKEL